MSKPVSESIDIAAPAPDVWRLISSPGHLEECHPFCAANPVEVWPGEGAVDRIEYYGGRKLVRHFVRWWEGRGYDIEITDDNGRVADVGWRLEETDNGSRLSIDITPRFLANRPLLLRAPLHAAIFRPMLRRYLRAVLAGVDYRVTTDRKVTRNQFGSHRLFSPAA